MLQYWWEKPDDFKTGTISNCELDFQTIYIMMDGYSSENVTIQCIPKNALIIDTDLHVFLFNIELRQNE